MFTFESLALALGVVLLFLLYRFFPGRKGAAVLCLVLAAALGFFLAYHRESDAVLTPERRAAIVRQQAIVSEWFASYQGIVEQLDRNWQQYHRILSDFEEDVISVQTVYERLRQLEPDAIRTTEALARMDPPIELRDESYDIVTAIIFKTRAYANAQRQTIHLTAEAADPENLLSDRQEEQSRRLRDVMITQSPAGLFTSEDIKALRESVAMPEA